MAKDASFFEEQKDQSLVKSSIVAKYFTAWSRVMIGAGKRGAQTSKIAYVDLFAGPGRYSDGSKSTPLLVLEQAISDPELACRLVACFNDGDPKNASSLTLAISQMNNIASLKYTPQIVCSELGLNTEDIFDGGKMVPTFSFIDPFGYKGLSRGIIQSVLKDWGCDCVFFFNYSRINSGLNNDSVRKHMDALFGSNRVTTMRLAMDTMKPFEREIYILEQLAEALREKGAKFMIPFRFRRADGSRTSHALIFVSKNVLGYSIMKDIMARASSTSAQGVPSFEYSPADARHPILFALNASIGDLKKDLPIKFAGKTLTAKSVFEMHNVDTPFIAKNYKQVLGELELEGKVVVIPPASERRMRLGERTFPDDTKVSFPPTTFPSIV